MQWILCSVVQWILIDCSEFHASWHNGSQLNAVDSMQRAKWISIEGSGFHAACLNAVYAMQREEMEPY